MLRLIFAVCLASAPLLATGQSMIYKVQMPDGSVLYSDSVPSGGKVLEEREAKSTPRVNTLPSQPAGKGTSPTGAVVRPGTYFGPGSAPGSGQERGAHRQTLPVWSVILPSQSESSNLGASRCQASDAGWPAVVAD